MLKLTTPLEQVFVTSDTHFGHTNIIDYASRPFLDSKEMDECLIDNWNSVVRKNQTVFHLGDFAFGNVDYQRKILSKLNGDIHFVRGNHDHNHPLGVDNLPDIIELKTGGRLWVLSHYAFRVWNCSHRGAINLYGHSHGCLKDDPKMQAIDVGVDAIAEAFANPFRRPEDYKPVSLAWVVEYMATIKEPFAPPF
jgi:calcineurin-like phosphoesterase family protein